MIDFNKVPPDKLPILMAKFFMRGPLALLRNTTMQDVVAPVRETLVNGKVFRYYPTQLPLASWVDQRTMTEGIDNFNFGDFEVTQISDMFNLERINIKVSPIYPQYGKVLSTEEVLPKIHSDFPVDGSEIVEWMHDATATMVVLSSREEEYNTHSQIETSCGDANIPGVACRSIAFERTNGYSYDGRGFATVVTPMGRINIPKFSLQPLVGRDFIAWAMAGAPYGIQWKGALGQLIRLASEITQPCGFINIDGFVAPHFVLQQPDKKCEQAIVRMVVDSDRNQRMKITFRDPNDYTRVIDEGEIDIPSGRSTIEFIVASYPSVPPLVNQMQPENMTRTVLGSFETRAR